MVDEDGSGIRNNACRAVPNCQGRPLIFRPRVETNDVELPDALLRRKQGDALAQPELRVASLGFSVRGFHRSRLCVLRATQYLDT